MIDFVVLAAPRTGSNHLCTLLGSTPGVAMHYELFHPNDSFFAKGTQASKALATPVQDRNADPVAFLNRVKASDSHLKVGFKLFPGHADKLMRHLVEAPGVRKLVLRRDNVLAVYASSVKAMMQQRFYAHDPSCPNVLVQFDAEKFDKFRATYEGWYAQIGALATEAGEPFFFLPYAQIGNPHVTAAAVHYVTGRTPRSELKSTHVKTGSTDIVSRFENADEVDAWLTANGHDAWRWE